jgi:hypothetical protein
MTSNRSVVVTTIASPTQSVRRCHDLLPDWRMIVVGDRKTPSPWRLDGVDFVPHDQPPAFLADFAALLPFDSYSRKNIGYLIAAGLSEAILETDDDNTAYDSFGSGIALCVSGNRVDRSGWINIYAAFAQERVWPRGLPLSEVSSSVGHPFEERGELVEADCPIQQFLADGDPDVDAIYRLTDGRPIFFAGTPLVLFPGTFTPLNSQNTLWWRQAFRLLYLPSFVSFRVTDIWRGLVATAVAQSRGWPIAVLPPTVRQERNPHDLMKDFVDEIPGYVENARLMDRLTGAVSGARNLSDGLTQAYRAIVSMGLAPHRELELIAAWNESLDRQGVD